MAVFGVGSLACIASIVRLTYIAELLQIHEGSSGYTLDVDRIGVWRYLRTLSSDQSWRANSVSDIRLASQK